jgi:lysophospholipid acyltransferase (LPLAT)-like uncharacterized protein
MSMRIRSPRLTAAIGWSAAMVFRQLARTLHYELLMDEPGLDPSGDVAEPFIYALWHDQILPPLARHTLTRPPVAALVSRHQDGSYLVEFMKHSGIRAVRGSSARGGDQALRELLDVPNEYRIFITPDGPRGPHHQLKAGPTYLASRSGRRIVPVVTAVPGCWYKSGSWTGLQIPKPFSTVYFRLGKPLAVPPDLDREELAKYTQRLQSQLEALEADLAEKMGDDAVIAPLPAASTKPARRAA